MSSSIRFTLDEPISSSTKIRDIYSPTHFKDRKDHLEQLETKINTEIGFRFWNKYVSAAFWSNISLPINLSITMMTALSTGQATTNNLLPQGLYINISVATLIVSVLNTYFRPHIQMNKNLEMMNKWNVLGCEFEEIFYSEKKILEQLDKCISRYEALIRKMNELKKTENLETSNFITDILYTILRSCECGFKHRNTWLALDESLKKENEQAKHIRQSELLITDDGCCSSINSNTVIDPNTVGIPTIDSILSKKEMEQYFKKYNRLALKHLDVSGNQMQIDGPNNV
jgi:hypothetical protein